MKKTLALVLAAMMALALCGVAFAADDANVSILGLDVGDEVSLYQILEWQDSTGWVLTSEFTGLDVAGVNAIIANTGNTLTKADVEAITNFVKNNNLAATESGEATASGFSKNVDLGMYLALIKPAKPDTLYNPMIVSADKNDSNSSSEIDASTAVLTSESISVAKKDDVPLEKTHSDITFNAGDYVQFTVTTTIPAFADSYAPWFNVTDKLSSGLKYAVDDGEHKFEVSSGDVGFTGGPVNGGSTFTIEFVSGDIENLTTPQDVTITYWAQVTTNAPFNVNEENNTVEVTFSNNPGNDSDHGHRMDKTVEYVFDIDASVNGDSSYTTGEIVKVGKGPNGTVILESKTLSNESKHEALQGAKFGVYTTEANATNDTTNGDGSYTHYYKNDVFTTGIVESDENGLLNIKGLKAGTYYIKELSAPDGFIKDNTVYSFTIEATTGTQTETETCSVCGKKIEYSYQVLTGYSVTFNGTTSTYTWTNDGPKVSDVVKNDESSEIVNTQGLELPSTGGIGTTIFYVAGLVMVLGAATILVARRKADAE